MKKETSRRSANWLPEEDEQLAKSWIHISQELTPLQAYKRQEFWLRISQDFNHHTLGPQRETRSVMHRWGHLQKSTLNFTAIHLEIQNDPEFQHHTPVEWLIQSKQVYFERQGKRFGYERAWNVLRNVKKWLTMSQGIVTNLRVPPDDSEPSPPRLTCAINPTHDGHHPPPSVQLHHQHPLQITPHFVPFNDPQLTNHHAPSTRLIQPTFRMIDSTTTGSNLEQPRTTILHRSSSKRKLDHDRDRLDQEADDERELKKKLKLIERSAKETIKRLNELKRLKRRTARSRSVLERQKMEMEIMLQSLDDCPDDYAREYLIIKKKKILESIKNQNLVEETQTSLRSSSSSSSSSPPPPSSSSSSPSSSNQLLVTNNTPSSPSSSSSSQWNDDQEIPNDEKPSHQSVAQSRPSTSDPDPCHDPDRHRYHHHHLLVPHHATSVLTIADGPTNYDHEPSLLVAQNRIDPSFL